MTIKKIPLKAMKAKEVPLEKLKFPLWAQLKYDGIRVITTVKDGQALFRTYNGSVIPMPELAAKFKKLDMTDMMIDGEVIIEGGRVGTRPTISGMINSAMHGGGLNESLVSYAIFDTMSLANFNINYNPIEYKYRYDTASLIAEHIGLPLARNTVVHSIKEVEELSEHMYSDGFEGLILKPPNHVYKFGRSADWIKIKETNTIDLTCYGTTRGTGKYTYMIGALCCTGKMENGEIILVNVGSGLTDSDRVKPLDTYIGKTIEVKFNSFIQDSVSGQWSLFLPRFSCVRFDK